MTLDLIGELGELAVASRLRRLSERLMQDATQIYQDAGVEFQPKWFPIFYLLNREGTLPVTEIATVLGVTHPAVNQVAGEMIRKDLVEALKDKDDARKRLLRLSKKGKALAPRLVPVWEDIRKTVVEVIDASGQDIIGMISRVEAVLDEEEFYSRVSRRIRQRQQDAVEIVEYDPALKKHFKSINLAWISRYFKVEKPDRDILDDPETHVLEPGGMVFFARDRETGEVLGTCALMKHGKGRSAVWELTKMGVLESARGRKIGRLLGEAVIDWAKKKKITSIMLETNSALAPALALYRKLGFERVPIDTPSPYARADVRMVLNL